MELLTMKLGVALAALALAATAHATAAVIVLDHGAPDYTTSARGLSDTAPYSEAANDLTALVADAVVGQVRFWGGYTGAALASDAFAVRLYGASSNYEAAFVTANIAPEALVRRTEPTGSLDGLDALGNPVVIEVYEYLATLSFTLEAGEAYLLSIQNSTPDTEGSWLWAFASEATEQGAIRSSPESLWYPVYGRYAFQLIGPDAPLGGTVPVPGTLALAALGLARLARLRPPAPH